jgi:hypothetical protein
MPLRGGGRMNIVAMWGLRVGDWAVVKPEEGDER